MSKVCVYYMCRVSTTVFFSVMVTTSMEMEVCCWSLVWRRRKMTELLSWTEILVVVNFGSPRGLQLWLVQWPRSLGHCGSGPDQFRNTPDQACLGEYSEIWQEIGTRRLWKVVKRTRVRKTSWWIKKLRIHWNIFFTRLDFANKSLWSILGLRRANH
jgi:hypothetical protein